VLFLRLHAGGRALPFGSQRILVGALQVAASLGLLAGLSQPWMGRAAAAGLALMILVAVGVRIRIKDSVAQTSPTFFNACLDEHGTVHG